MEDVCLFLIATAILCAIMYIFKNLQNPYDDMEN